jgi:alkylation response protein AidB-like acyl-CoA dehydrogenase
VDRDLWEALGDMGVFAITLPSADGGVGLGLAEAVIAFEELGRAVVPGPLVASFLAAPFVDGAANGRSVVGAVSESHPAVVEHLEALDALLVFGSPGVRRVETPQGRPLPRPLDPLTPVHVVDALDGGQLLADAAAGARLAEVASLLVAALQVGLGDASVAAATSYALERRQFGRPVGSFQALKHLLADAHVWVDVARAAVHAAAVDIDERGVSDADAVALSTATCAVTSARAVAGRAAARATATSVQVHGGIGYTWDADPHLYLKRAAVLDVAFGSVDAELEQRAAQLVSR